MTHNITRLSVGFMLICFTSLVAGAEIVFEASPSTINIPFSPTLTVRCGLNDTTSAGSDAIVGRDVTHTNDDVQSVTSLVVTRDTGDHVASVTSSGPQAFLDVKLKVTGDVNVVNSEERAFIELTWSDPTLAQIGTYRCDVTTVSSDGQSRVYSKSLDVIEGTANAKDLANYIHTIEAGLRADVAALKVENQNLKNQINSLGLGGQTCNCNATTVITVTDDIKDITDNVNQLQVESHNYEATIQQLNEEIHHLQLQDQKHNATIKALDSKISDLELLQGQGNQNNNNNNPSGQGHIETGHVDCGGYSSRWPVAPWDSAKSEAEAAVTFTSPYTSPPVVFASFSHIEYNAMPGQSELRPYYYTNIFDVTEDGFKVNCVTSDAIVLKMQVTWISFAQ